MLAIKNKKHFIPPEIRFVLQIFRTSFQTNFITQFIADPFKIITELTTIVQKKNKLLTQIDYFN